jgi:SpoVK/Ycf46/Vps4 family AAA+-type ATPase
LLTETDKKQHLFGTQPLALDAPALRVTSPPLPAPRPSDRAEIATELAALTNGCTGADIAFVCQRAALLCVKAAAREHDNVDIAITGDHFRAAVAMVTHTSAPISAASSSSQRVHAVG